MTKEIPKDADVKYQRIKGTLYIFVNGKLFKKVDE